VLLDYSRRIQGDQVLRLYIQYLYLQHIIVVDIFAEFLACFMADFITMIPTQFQNEIDRMQACFGLWISPSNTSKTQYPY
jgi:hypothetical protein